MSKLKIYLASQSPRRRQLLEQLEIDCKIISTAIDEAHVNGETAEYYVTRLALEKARQGWTNSEQSDLPVLGADTCIVVNGAIVGKPGNVQHAMDILKSLSGSQHEVLTAIALVGVPVGGKNPGQYREITRLSRSQVRFRHITDRERKWYWNTGEPAGKAGGYAIQGLGAMFIEKIDGSYSGIMGLPLYELMELLAEFGFEITET